MFVHELSLIDWSPLYCKNNVNDMYNWFLLQFTRLTEKYFPIRKLITKSKKNPWITNGIKISSCKKYELFRDMLSNPNDSELKNH